MSSSKHFSTNRVHGPGDSTLGSSVLSYIDWLIPPAISAAGSEAVRRSRLLVIASSILILFALPFLVLAYSFEGHMSPTAWSFVSGTGLLLFNLFLLRWTGSYILSGVLFAAEIILHFAFMAYHNGGYHAAVLVWHPVIPLLTTLLVGPKIGFACALFVAAETLLFYFLSESGYPFPRPLTPEQMRIFHVAGSTMVILFTGSIALLYERLHKSALALAERTYLTSRRNERYFRALIESTSDFISILDKDGVIRYVNPAHEHGLGYSIEELQGKSAWDFLHPEDADRLSQRFQNALSIPGVLPRLEFRFRALDGAWRILEATADNLLHDPAVRGVIITSRDITERKHVEQLKDELVSTVSHELRTPLTSLRGFAELMLKKDFARDKQREFLSIIQNESVRLTNLINDFLDLQRLESRRQTYNLAPTHLDVLMREVAETLLPESGEHILQTEFPAQLPLVDADVDRLRQVLSNLISNAVKYSPLGGRITIGASAQDKEVIAWVADEGLGIPTHALPQLFTKFFRVDNQDTRRIGGTGLGLSLIKKIIETHGGRVWVESTEGVGSAFSFSLPIAEPATATAA